MTPSRLALIALLLIALPSTTATADILTFQQGDGGAYSTTDAVSIDPTGTNHGSLNTIGVFGAHTGIESLLRFPDIIGSASGQIPSGSTLTSASLALTMADGFTNPVPTDMHEVYVAWDENTVSGVTFYAQPGTLYGPKVGTMPAGAPLAQVSADVTLLVQDWLAGAPNFGLMLRLAVDGLTVYYSEDVPELVRRPKLTVEFTPPPVAVEATTWGRVKALYR